MSFSVRSVDVDDERDAVQQITALKDANYVLQKELEEGQKKTDNLLKEFEEKVLKLEEELAKAQNQVKKVMNNTRCLVFLTAYACLSALLRIIRQDSKVSIKNSPKK